MVSRIICGPNTGWSNRTRDPEMWLISSFFMVKCGPTEMLLITSLFLMAKSVALLPCTTWSSPHVDQAAITPLFATRGGLSRTTAHYGDADEGVAR